MRVDITTISLQPQYRASIPEHLLLLPPPSLTPAQYACALFLYNSQRHLSPTNSPRTCTGSARAAAAAVAGEAAVAAVAAAAVAAAVAVAVAAVAASHGQQQWDGSVDQHI